jgi:hypothetical protein
MMCRWGLVIADLSTGDVAEVFQLQVLADCVDLGAQDWDMIHGCLPDQRPMDTEVFMHQNVA